MPAPPPPTTECFAPGCASRCLACLPVLVLSQQALNHRQGKGKCLAAACLGTCCEVLALHGRPQDHALDGKQGLNATALQGTHHLRTCSRFNSSIKISS